MELVRVRVVVLVAGPSMQLLYSNAKAKAGDETFEIAATRARAYCHSLHCYNLPILVVVVVERERERERVSGLCWLRCASQTRFEPHQGHRQGHHHPSLPLRSETWLACVQVSQCCSRAGVGGVGAPWMRTRMTMRMTMTMTCLPYR